MRCILYFRFYRVGKVTGKIDMYVYIYMKRQPQCVNDLYSIHIHIFFFFFFYTLEITTVQAISNDTGGTEEGPPDVNDQLRREKKEDWMARIHHLLLPFRFLSSCVPIKYMLFFWQSLLNLLNIYHIFPLFCFFFLFFCTTPRPPHHQLQS